MIKNRSIISVFFILSSLYCCFLNAAPSRDNDKTWWKTANYYQIYPKSFQDSDGDGIGDLKGITERLSYLQEIGITATWLSPIFASPMVDNGYDISDFRKIDETFGTLEHFEELVKKAKELGIKVILDFVPNHSSDQHEWFKKSVNNEGKYADYYVWVDGKPDPNNPGKFLPPNNWKSVFGGSAWTYNENRKKFYYHQFYKEQPDLNYRNEDVKKEMIDVLIYWLEKGVDGFRIDAVPHIFEDTQLRDEPLREGAENEDDYGSYDHKYTYDLDETFEIIYDWRDVLDDYVATNGGPDKVILAEAYSPTITKMRYYGNDTRKGAQFPFNFLLLGLNEHSKAIDYKNMVDEWMNAMPEQETANWVFGNHDQPRIANRLGRKRTTLANLFIMSLPGVTVTYYGEEIGMENIELEEPSLFYMEDKRNGERSPMQWSDDIAAGFSTNNKTWLPVAPDFKRRNVKVQRRIFQSHLNQYKRMAELRTKYQLYTTEGFSIDTQDDIIIITKKTDNFEIKCFFNIGKISKIKNLLRQQYEVLLTNEHSTRMSGDKISGDFEMYPNEVLILKA